VKGHSILRCLYCRTIYIHPLPSQKKHEKFHDREYFYKNYGSSINDFYKGKSLSFQKEMQVKTARLDYVSRFSKAGKILDVGTGQGLFLVLAQDRGWEAFGTDISGYVCEFLKKNKNIKTFNGYLEEARLPHDFFDVVTMWHVLEHVYDPHETLLEVKKLLKVGGHLFIAVPNTLTLEIYLRKIFRKPHFREGVWEWHFYCFNPESLKYLLKSVGFKIEGTDSESYLKRNKYERFTQVFLRLAGINMCRTILIHAIKSGNNQ